MGNFNWIYFLILGSCRNLMRSPRRTLISLVAIGAATSSLIVFQSFVEGVASSFRTNVVTSRFGHYQLFDRKSYETKTYDGYERLIKVGPEFRKDLEKEVGPIGFISRQLSFFGLMTAGEQNAGARAIGVDAADEKEFLTLTQVYEGKHLADSGKNGIFVGYQFAEKLGIKVGDNVSVVVNTAEGSINAIDFDVTGLFKSGVIEMDTGMFFVHYDTAQQLMGVDGAQRVLIGFDGPDETIYEKKLNDFIAARYPALVPMHWQALATYFENTMGWLSSIFFVFRLIIILIAALSIVNVFTITLLERTGEFGTLRAIGTRRGEITSMILTEGMMQAVLGSVFGAAVGIGIIKLALTSGVTMPPPLMMSVPFHVAFKVPWEGVWISTILCTAIAGSSGLFPAFKMARTNIVQALGRNV